MAKEKRAAATLRVRLEEIAEIIGQHSRQLKETEGDQVFLINQTEIETGFYFGSNGKARFITPDRTRTNKHHIRAYDIIVPSQGRYAGRGSLARMPEDGKIHMPPPGQMSIVRIKEDKELSLSTKRTLKQISAFDSIRVVLANIVWYQLQFPGKYTVISGSRRLDTQKLRLRPIEINRSMFHAATDMYKFYFIKTHLSLLFSKIEAGIRQSEKKPSVQINERRLELINEAVRTMEHLRFSLNMELTVNAFESLVAEKMDFDL